MPIPRNDSRVRILKAPQTKFLAPSQVFYLGFHQSCPSRPNYQSFLPRCYSYQHLTMQILDVIVCVYLCVFFQREEDLTQHALVLLVRRPRATIKDSQ